MSDFLNVLINGIGLGGVYALIALGYTMVYGIAKMLNFAHGDIIMVGGYAMFVTLAQMDYLVVAIIFAILFCVIIGIVMEKVAYKPLRGASPLAVLITAIGVSYFLQSLAQILFGTNPKKVNILPSLTSDQKTGIVIGVAILVMAILTIFIQFSKVGKAMRAVSEDRGAASLMGINSDMIISITFAIGCALAAVASICYLMMYPTSLKNTMGSLPGIKAFTAAVIGGIGSIPGAMLGGFLLGIIEAICNYTPLASYTVAIEFAILIIILIIRPIGILGKKRREKV